MEKTKGTLRILTHINENSATRISEITSETGLTTYMTYSTLGQLIDLKLIKEELSGGFPSKKCYRLTKKGMVKKYLVCPNLPCVDGDQDRTGGNSGFSD